MSAPLLPETAALWAFLMDPCGSDCMDAWEALASCEDLDRVLSLVDSYLEGRFKPGDLDEMKRFIEVLPPELGLPLLFRAWHAMSWTLYYLRPHLLAHADLALTLACEAAASTNPDQRAAAEWVLDQLADAERRR